MHLYILGQDIRELDMGLEKNGEFLQSGLIRVSPEQYLSAIADQLNKWNTSLDDIEGIYVVTGPGSFTASRVSITIANAIAFSKQIPVFPVENRERYSLRELYDLVKRKQIKPEEFVLPHYDRQPNITVAK